MSLWRFMVIFLTALVLLVGSSIVVFTLIAYRSADSQIVDTVELVPETPVALVLGASVQPDKKPSGVLRDRIRTAVALLEQKRVSKLLLSGDNRETHYNEVAAMRRTAIEMGAPPEALVLDFAGRRTYDSCLRAREVFGLYSIVVVTQSFHLARAIYLCTKLGIDTIGVPADGPGYSTPWRLMLREIAAWILVFIDVNIDEPRTVLGPPIPIEGASSLPVLETHEAGN
jgi:SanA protein